MPICFQLINIDTGEVEKLQEVDNKMAAYFGKIPDDTTWFRNWYNVYGMWLAYGMGFESIIQEFKDGWINKEGDEGLLNTIMWLQANYTVESWRE